MKALVLAVILLGLGHGNADAGRCKPKGKVLFRETTGPLKDAPVSTTDVPRATYTIHATGAWESVVVSPDGEEQQWSGCLPRSHLKELKRTLAKAKFQLEPEFATCKALSTKEVVYASPKRKKRVTTAAPCGTPVDDWTANLAACAEIPLLDPEMDAKQIRAVCRGEYESFESR